MFGFFDHDGAYSEAPNRVSSFTRWVPPGLQADTVSTGSAMGVEVCLISELAYTTVRGALPLCGEAAPGSGALDRSAAGVCHALPLRPQCGTHSVPAVESEAADPNLTSVKVALWCSLECWSQRSHVRIQNLAIRN